MALAVAQNTRRLNTYRMSDFMRRQSRKRFCTNLPFSTCQLRIIQTDFPHLADVLQRVGRHPAARVAELTPRLWKQHFAANPMRSDLHALRR
jgi:hypothetical protein